MKKTLYDFDKSIACGLLMCKDKVFLGNLFPDYIFKLTALGYKKGFQVDNTKKQLFLCDICHQSENDKDYMEYVNNVDNDYFPFGYIGENYKIGYGIYTKFLYYSYESSSTYVDMLVKSLTIDEIGIIAQHWKTSKSNKLDINEEIEVFIRFNQKINVRFETEINFPVLFLPEHTAYVIEK